MIRYFLILLTVFSLIACSNAEEEKLREIVNEELTVETSDTLSSLDAVTLEQYRDIELARNKQYVSSLSNLLENGFDIQLEKFEDEELGFLASYGYMFDYFLMGLQEIVEHISVAGQKAQFFIFELLQLNVEAIF